MSLMYGFSIISYIEILYFASGKFFTLYFEHWKLKLQRKLSRISTTVTTELDNDPPPAYTLYWQEFKPKQPVDMEIFKEEFILNLYKKENDLKKPST